MFAFLLNATQFFDVDPALYQPASLVWPNVDRTNIDRDTVYGHDSGFLVYLGTLPDKLDRLLLHTLLQGLFF